MTPSWIDQRGTALASAPVGQTLVAAIRSGGSTIAEGQNVGGTASVSPADHNRLALVVAVRHYRDPWPGADAKPAADPARLAASLQQKLGVSKDRLMLLEDELANRLDIEEALTRWLPERMGRETLLFVYFVGHTIVDAQTGEVYLVPYDAAPDAPLYRFLPLRRLHSHLNQLEAKLSLVFIDGRLSHAIRKRAVLTGPDTGRDRRFEPPGALAPESCRPDARQILTARRALAAVPGGRRRLLYARVDLVADARGRPVVLEVELIEPQLHLARAPAGAQRLAKAIAARARSERL